MLCLWFSVVYSLDFLDDVDEDTSIDTSSVVDFNSRGGQAERFLDQSSGMKIVGILTWFNYDTFAEKLTFTIAVAFLVQYYYWY
jgi:hypothetical protein